MKNSQVLSQNRAGFFLSSEFSQEFGREEFLARVWPYPYFLLVETRTTEVLSHRMARRVRTTVTVREDDPVPARRSNKKKKQSSVVVVILLVLLVLFLISRTNQRAGRFPNQSPAGAPHR